MDTLGKVFFPVRKKNEEDLDKISNRVFGIVGETVEDVPYFSFLDLMSHLLDTLR